MMYGRAGAVIVTAFDAAVARAGETLISNAVAYCRLRMQSSCYKATGSLLFAQTSAGPSTDLAAVTPSLKLLDEVARETAVALAAARSVVKDLEGTIGSTAPALATAAVA